MVSGAGNATMCERANRHHARRNFLVAGGMSCFGFDLASPALADPTETPRRKIATSAILI